MNAVTCTHVTRRFGSLTAVDDISLQVSDGEIFGIIGPNGAGKTTLLSSIEGLDEPTSGEVTVLGLHPVKDAAELARRTGIRASSRPHSCLDYGSARPWSSSPPSTTTPCPGARCWSASASPPRRRPTSPGSPVGSASVSSSPWPWFMIPSCSSSTS